MKWISVLTIVLACGAPTAVPSNTPVASPDAPPAPVPAIDVRGTLRAVAKARLAELEARPAVPPMTAFGPCTRPDPAEQATLRTRIEAALHARWPGAAFDEPPELVFGCVDRGGAIVDVAVDTGTRAGSPPDHGHWLTVRVTPGKITTVVEATGIPSTWGGEWAVSTSQHTAALADLDGDGVFDVISVKQLHEGGAMTSELTVTAALSSGPSHTSGTFGDAIVVAPQPLVPGGPVVMVARERDPDGGGERERVIVRCVDRDGALARSCREAAPVQRLVEVERAARRIGELESSAVLDRDDVAELASLFELGERERTALLAATEPEPASELLRAIERFRRLEAGYDTLTFERLARVAAERDRLSAAVLTELGEAACPAGTATPALTAKARIRIVALEGRSFGKLAATEPTIKEQCELQTCSWKPLPPAAVTVSVPCAVGDKRYVLAEWKRTARSGVTVQRKALLYAAGERLELVLDQGRFEMGGPWPPPFPLAGQFYRRGDTLIGIVFDDLDLDIRRVLSVIDGVIGDRRTGEVELYDLRPLVVHHTAGNLDILHAGAKLERVALIDPTAPPTAPAGALVALVVGHEHERAARELLRAGANLSEASSRAAVIDALTVLRAPPELIARVRALP